MLGQIVGLLQLCWVRLLVCFNCVGSDCWSASIVLGQIVGLLQLCWVRFFDCTSIVLGQIFFDCTSIVLGQIFRRLQCVGSECWSVSIVLGQIVGPLPFCWVRLLSSGLLHNSFVLGRNLD